MQPNQSLAFKVGKQASDGLARRADGVGNFFVGKRQYRAGWFNLRCPFTGGMPRGKIQQETSQLFFHRSREPQAADFAISRVVDVAQSLCHSQRHFAVSTEKLQEGPAGNEIRLGRLLRFGGCLVGFSGNRPWQADHFTGLGEAQDQRLSARGAGTQLYATVANHEDASWFLAFDKENRALGIRCGRRYGVESREGGRREAAKKAILVQRTGQATLNDFEAVRRFHGYRGAIIRRAKRE